MKKKKGNLFIYDHKSLKSLNSSKLIMKIYVFKIFTLELNFDVTEIKMRVIIKIRIIIILSS